MSYECQDYACSDVRHP